MNICVTSSSSVSNTNYIKLVHDYLEPIMDLDLNLLCGGISSSMMKEVYEIFLNNDKDIRVYTLACYNEPVIPNMSILNSTFDRTKKLYEEADIICVFPGGSGSAAELFSFIEEARTQNAKPIIIVNSDNFFEAIFMHIKKLIDLGFNKESILDYIDIVNTKKEFIEKVRDYYGKKYGKIS